MNTELRKKTKNEFEKGFSRFMNNAIFRKSMKNVRNRVNIKLITTKIKRNYLVSEPNYLATKSFSENLLVIEIKKKLNIHE